MKAVPDVFGHGSGERSQDQWSSRYGRVDMKQKTVCVILPALNEEETIGKVIEEIPRGVLEEKGYRVNVLIVDGNSTDLTREVALDTGAEVIIEPRPGKGRAMKTAFQRVQADFVVMMDADYTYPATYIPDLLNMLQQGYDVVIGSRLMGRRDYGSISRLNIVGNRLLTMMASILYLTRISDLCTGYWGFKGEVISKLHLSAEGFNLEADLFAQVAKNGHSLGQVPIYYRRRSTPSKLGSIKAGLNIAKTLIRERFC